jgi:hypothetical protein
MNLYEKLEKLKNLSFRYGQKNPDDIPNYYDREIEALFAIARAKGVKLDEEGHFEMDQKSIAVAKKKSHG